MAVPKQKHSKSRTRKRRSHNALKPKQLIECKNCGKMILSHRVCDTCGFYGKKEIIKPDVK